MSTTPNTRKGSIAKEQDDFRSAWDEDKDGELGADAPPSAPQNVGAVRPSVSTPEGQIAPEKK